MMTFKKLGGVLVVILVLGGVVWGEGGSLSLDLATKWAVETQESVLRQSESIEQALARLQQLQGQTMPQLSFWATEAYQDDALSAGGSSITTSHKPEYKFSVAQPLFTGFRDGDAYASAKALLRSENTRLDQVRLAVKQQVIGVFFQVLTLQWDLEILQEAKRSSEGRIGELDYRVKFGKSRTSELFAAQSQLLLIKAQIEALGAQISSGRVGLSRLVGRDVGGYRLEVPGDFAVVPSLSAAQLADRVAHRSEIGVLLAEIDAQRAQVQLAQRTWLPNVNLGANYYLKRSEALDPIKWDLAVAAQFPLFQGGTEFAAIRTAESQLRVAQLTVADTTHQLLAQIAEDLTQLRSSGVQKKLLNEAVTKIEASYNLDVQEYRLGLVTNLDVLAALDQVVTTKRSSRKAQADFLSQAYAFQLNWGGF